MVHVQLPRWENHKGISAKSAVIGPLLNARNVVQESVVLNVGMLIAMAGAFSILDARRDYLNMVAEDECHIAALVVQSSSGFERLDENEELRQ